MATAKTPREGSLEAPTRHPVEHWTPDFWDQQKLDSELERVFDICHGCRRCVSLCQSFPTLFDLVDESDTMEVDGVDVADYQQVVDHCYLCDLCYMTKCPYVPPHDWNVDFPHLMLRAKMVNFRKGDTKLRDRLITSTDMMGKTLSHPGIAPAVNALNNLPPARKLLESTLAIHADAHLPAYTSKPLRKNFNDDAGSHAQPTDNGTTGKVVLFTTCYGNYNEPGICEDLAAVFRHNKVEVKLLPREACCGMPKLELGDLEAVKRLKDANIAQLYQQVLNGWDIVAPVPSCVLMFKQELPLLFPDDEQVAAVGRAMFDPFEYLMLRHKAGLLNTDFSSSLGKVSYQAACHQRVQNIGPKTRDILQLIPDTEVSTVERCSGHDGTYAVKKESYEASRKIVRGVTRAINKHEPDYYGSDCPMAGAHIEENLANGKPTSHPMSLLRKAYGLDESSDEKT